MSLITIKEYAEKNNKTVKAVEWHLRNETLKSVKKYGKRLIDSRTKWPKRAA